MALGPRIELRQSQTLVMTPQLQQAIKLLQLSNVELADYVKDELLENPLLEEGEASDPAEPLSAEANESDDVMAGADLEVASVTSDESLEFTPDESRDFAERQLTADGLGDGSTTEVTPELESVDIGVSGDLGELADAEALPLDIDIDEVFEKDSVEARVERDQTPATSSESVAVTGSSRQGDERPDLEATLASEVTLRDHLLEQLPAVVNTSEEQIIGVWLIDAIDETGYVTDDLAEIAATIGAAPGQVEAVLECIQSLDPAGVGARDLSECLALQLRDLDRLDPVMQTFLDNLEMFAAGELEAIKTACGADDEDLAEMIAEIRALDPKPGLRFEESVSEPVVPDVFVYRNSLGEWVVELNEQVLPRLIVNEGYHATVSEGLKSDEERKYLNERLQSASWLIRSLDQRARTILRVSSELVRQQGEFLEKGVQGLKPLTLRHIADAIGMHESTVSRVTSNKFMETPKGTFEMKYFFTSAIQSVSGGDMLSAEAVRQRIRHCIEQESAERILSDDKIVSMLKESGVDIARRTVAKYREAMNIPSSVERRKQKRLVERQRAIGM